MLSTSRDFQLTLRFSWKKTKPPIVFSVKTDQAHQITVFYQIPEEIQAILMLEVETPPQLARLQQRSVKASLRSLQSVFCRR